ncbi:MAG: metallophosphoesterase [Bacteroidetes bacterium]|nr:metallophosphoesterase [Bacteroidota bacterium]
MPGIYSKQNRRDFIKTSGKIISGLSVMAINIPLVRARSKENEISMALLSDTHIPEDTQNVYRGFKPYKNLKKIALDVANSKTENAIINGDIARLTGEPGDYKNVQSLLQPIADKKPIFMTLGNHDNRDNFHDAFSRQKELQEVDGKHVLVIEQQGLRFVLLDSLLYINRTAGLLGKTQRSWLQSYLSKVDDKPTFLFVHHTLSDEDGALLDTDKFFSIIKPMKQVKAVFYGHSHRYQYDQLDGIHLINQPAVGYNFADDQPVGWLTGKFSDKGADLTLNAFDGNTQNNGKTTSISWR